MFIKSLFDRRDWMDNLQDLLTVYVFNDVERERETLLYKDYRRSNGSMSVDHWHFGRCDLVIWSSTTRFPSPPLGYAVLCALSTISFTFLYFALYTSRPISNVVDDCNMTLYTASWDTLFPHFSFLFGVIKNKTKKGNPFFTCRELGMSTDALCKRIDRFSRFNR